MKGFFDTSVLVAVFYGDHVHHKSSLELFVRFDKSTGCCGAHSLVEVYSTLTRMPGKHRISGEQAMLFTGSIRERHRSSHWPEMNTPTRRSPPLPWASWAVEFMTRCLRIAPSRQKPKRFSVGTYDIMPNAVRM